MKLLFKLKNGGKEDLTMDEARELYNELHLIFGKPEVTKPMLDWPTIGDKDYPWPYVNPFGPITCIDTFSRSNLNGTVTAKGTN